MTLTIECNSCRGEIGNRDEIYCRDCYGDKVSEIEKLKDQIKDLESELSQERQEVTNLQSEIDKLLAESEKKE